MNESSDSDFETTTKRVCTQQPAKVSIAVRQSRYANCNAIVSLASRLGTDESMQSAMVEAKAKLLLTKQLMYTRGLTADIVRSHGVLERFVCWTSAISQSCGVSRNTAGHGYASGQYFKVSVGKSTKFQAHKLMLCLKLNKLYTQLEEEGCDSSHLCHNRLCWRDTHLTNESHADNLSRASCPGWLVDMNTKKIACLCEHSPPCEFVHFRHLDWSEL